MSILKQTRWGGSFSKNQLRRWELCMFAILIYIFIYWNKLALNDQWPIYPNWVDGKWEGWEGDCSVAPPMLEPVGPYSLGGRDLSSSKGVKLLFI